MAELVTDCPRCRACKITFECTAEKLIAVDYGWMADYEAFCTCRQCGKSSIFVLRLKNSDHKGALPSRVSDATLNLYFEIRGVVSIKDTAAVSPPDHLPREIEAQFREGAACLAIGCHNAAAAMFRLCLDTSTRELLPSEDEAQPGAATRRSLGLRLQWLLENGRLDRSLEELSHCIKEDGNDGAHVGSLSEQDALDVLDFTVEVLERLYTTPKRLDLAKQRRAERRK